MSYSFTVRAASKAEAIGKVTEELAKVVVNQSMHAKDKDQAKMAAVNFINLLRDDATRDVAVSVSGSISWNDGDQVNGEDVGQQPGHGKYEDPGDQRHQGRKTQGDIHEGNPPFQFFLDCRAKANTHAPPPMSSQPMIGGNDTVSPQFEPTARVIAKHGWLLQQHSISLAENDFHLNAFRSIAREYPIDGLRWAIIHLQSIDTARLKSLMELGAGASACTSSSEASKKEVPRPVAPCVSTRKTLPSLPVPMKSAPSGPGESVQRNGEGVS